MFTGIVQAIGFLDEITPNGKGSTIKISSSSFDFSDVNIGDSIACNGVCITVTKLNNNSFWGDVSHETMDCTTFKKYKKGQSINLEKALTPMTHMGGHIVQGHVDGVGVITSIIKKDGVMDVWIKAPQELGKYIAHKGSITIDGVSLTVNELKGDLFRLTLIPHTHEITTTDNWVNGEEVNVEVDVLSRYLERLLESKESQKNKGLTKETLLSNGFF
ncbi:MAG: riboflavin synthase [Succinivibrionaceae bacterium]|nr:riboflavin synthase [Succinivibrionaceae bacterium]